MPVVAVQPLGLDIANQHQLDLPRLVLEPTPSSLRITLWPPSQPTSQPARTRSVTPARTSVAVTLAASWTNPVASVPRCTRPPSSASRWRRSCSVRHCGMISTLAYGRPA